MKVTQIRLTDSELVMDLDNNGTMLYDGVRIPLTNGLNNAATKDDTIINIRMPRDGLEQLIKAINASFVSPNTLSIQTP